MSFFTEEEKAEAVSMLNEAFNTFKEQIYVYQSPEQTVISTDPNYVWSFGNDQPDIQVTNTTQSGVFWATVEYMNNESLQRIDHSIFNESILSKQGLVRISVSGVEAFNFLKKAEKITFDDQNFKVVSDLQRRGLFTRDFSDLWLSKID